MCGCLCLSRYLSGRFNSEGLVPHKQYFAGTLLGMSGCASYVSRTHDVIDDVTRSQSRSNFEIDLSASIFELQRRSKAQNVENSHGYLSGIFNFRYSFIIVFLGYTCQKTISMNNTFRDCKSKVSITGLLGDLGTNKQHCNIISNTIILEIVTASIMSRCDFKNSQISTQDTL